MSDIQVTSHSPRVEQLFEPYAAAIGADLPGYKNHVYRCITYAMHFLDGNEADRPLVETAFVYHDLGLWTDKACAYLEPSEARAVADNEREGWNLDPEALRAAIHWHHKIRPYRGPHQEVVEACRKADWVDANKGMVRKGLTRAQIATVEGAIANEGFHDSLVRLAKDNGGSTLGGLIKVLRGIIKW